jgi:hypothetical protein
MAAGYYLTLGPATIAGACATLISLSKHRALTLENFAAAVVCALLVIGGALFTYLGGIEVRHVLRSR